MEFDSQSALSLVTIRQSEVLSTPPRSFTDLPLLRRNTLPSWPLAFGHLHDLSITLAVRQQIKARVLPGPRSIFLLEARKPQKPRGINPLDISSPKVGESNAGQACHISPLSAPKLIGSFLLKPKQGLSHFLMAALRNKFHKATPYTQTKILPCNVQWSAVLFFLNPVSWNSISFFFSAARHLLN